MSSLRDGLTSRADLLEAICESVTFKEQTARLFGYQFVPRIESTAAEDVDSRIERADSSAVKATAVGTRHSTSPSRYQPDDTPFWQVTSHEYYEKATQHDALGPMRVDLDAIRQAIREQVAGEPIAEFRPLAERKSIVPRLQKQAGSRESAGSYDLDKAIDLLCRCELMQRIPRQQKQIWGGEILILQDRSRRLVPYWADQDYLTSIVYDTYPNNACSVCRFTDEGAVLRFDSQGRLLSGSFAMPPPETLVLAMSDLGCLEQTNPSRPNRRWTRLGERLTANGNRCLALVPCRPDLIGDELSQFWQILVWEQSNASGSGEADLNRLLAMVSPAIRLESQLLRAIRMLHPDGPADAGLESLVWQHRIVDSGNIVAATLTPPIRREFIKRFQELDLPQQDRVVKLIQQWHQDLAVGILVEETVGVSPRMKEQVEAYFIGLAQDLEQLDENSKAWLGRMVSRLPGDMQLSSEATDAVHELVALVRKDGNYPVFFDPRHSKTKQQQRRQISVYQASDRLVFQSTGTPSKAGSSLLAAIETHTGEIRMDDAVELFWRNGTAPAWADRWGEDQFGKWVEFVVHDVCQRMRWVAPTTFWMGSPDDEEGRYSDEVRHQVTITNGFWLFDTQCTRALWRAVTDENPSEFKGDARPVESVSWDDANDFLEKLEAKSGPSLRLPTDAEWELACRAGTDTAHYGPLDDVAWHLGNSERQTHDVKQRTPNSLGLFDMLGNVWEWCQDACGDEERLASELENYKATDRTDPVLKLDAADRVIRGGSWRVSARSVRAAYRSWVHRGYRSNGVGFRCAQFSSESQPASEEPKRGDERARDDDHANRRVRTALPRVVDLDQQGQAECEIPRQISSYYLHSDVEAIHARQITRPLWASSIGRDEFGLWSEFELDGLTQRMRWIPPGRFQMGSSENEAGRNDSYEWKKHLVTITQGFWLFDTPCTQELWEAGMGENQSEFKSPRRPVENVSWDQAIEFMTKLNEKASLNLGLPTEAEWEYACRADTDTATYAGDLDILGQNNAPILDAVAWYGGNSGHKFDLQQGYTEAKGWPEKQYAFDMAGTRIVAKKSPNRWGLYDMLGNVWEWCVDASDSTEPRADPMLPDGMPARVIRGGSWHDSARYVRAAFRFWFHRVNRDDDVGFRCAHFSEAERAAQVEVSRDET